MIPALFHAWDNWWCRSAPPHALAIARIAIGIFWLLLAVEYGSHLFMLFSSAGVAMPLFGDGFLPVTFFDAPPPIAALFMYIVLLLCITGFILGYKMRTCLLGILCIGFLFWQLSMHLFPATIHRVSLLFLIVFLFGGADKALSLRMRLQRGAWTAWEPVSLLPQRLLSVQITVTYLGAGLQKLWLPGWEDGGILAASLISSWATPLAFFIARIGWSSAQYDFAVIAITAFEIFLPVSFWIPRMRWAGFTLGALFHIAIAILLSIWSFLVLIPLYVLFFPPERVRFWIERCLCRNAR